MDATASSRVEKAPLPNGDDGTSSESSVKVEQQPETLPAVTHGETGGEEDVQVERFFALLANIRTLRAMHRAAECRGRKRARDAEPPWRPAFRLEDFVDEEGAGKKKKKKKKVEGMGGTSAVADADEIVETTGGPDGPSGRCVAARR